MIYYIYLLMEVMLFGIGIGSSEFFINLGFVGFILSTMGIMVFNIIFIINLGNLFQYCYSKRKDLFLFPLYLCPFLISQNKDKQIKIKFIGIRKEFFRVLLPMEIIEDTLIYNEKNKDVKSQKALIFKNSLQVQVVGRMIGIILVALAEAIPLHSVTICIYGIGLIVIQRALSEFSSIDYYVGEKWVQMGVDIRSDKFIDYCASQISYHDTVYKVLYDAYQENLLRRDNLFLVDWCAYNLMHMSILEYSEKISFRQELRIQLQHEVSQIESMQAASYQWYGLMTYLYLSILNNQEETVESFIRLVEAIKSPYEIVPVWISKTIRFNYFDWCIDLAKYHKIGRKNSGKPKYKILMRDSLCKISEDYFNCYIRFEQEILKAMN